MAANFPVPAPMEVKGDLPSNWQFFQDQWQDYEIATGLEKKDNSIRVATLRTVMGKECLNIFKSLDITADDAKVPAKCLQSLKEYFEPKRNEIYERYIFYTCDQGPEEPVDTWVTRLRQLIKQCNFAQAERDSLLRDRIVLGTTDKAARLRMLREKDLTLNLAIEMLRASEITSSQIRVIDKTANTEETVSFTKRRSQGSSARPPKNEGRLCKFCCQIHVWGRDNCPAYGKECGDCGRANHASGSVLCKNDKGGRGGKDRNKGQKSRKNRGANFVDEEEASLYSDDSCYSVIHTVAHMKVNKQPRVQLLFSEEKSGLKSRKECVMDTGTSCNVMSVNDLKELVPNATLRRSEARLHLYDGSYMKPLGVYSMYAQYAGKRQRLRFEIVSTAVARKPLLSANTCQRLGLLQINIPKAAAPPDEDKVKAAFPDPQPAKRSSQTGTHNHVYANESQRQWPREAKALIDKYPDVFEGLGCLPGELHLEIDKTVPPVQHVPRKVPIAMKSQVKDKIDAMVKAGVLAKVDKPTDWISSMVVVKKPDKLRICIDPKDLNTALKRNKNIMPTMEDVMPELAGAKVFSVLDAKDGFHQVKLDTESSYLTTFWTPFGRFRWLRMPFGISPAPEEYQMRQKQVLEGLQGIFNIADDILCVGYGETLEEATKDHDKNLEKLLQRCRDVNLKLNKKKAKLRLTEVKYVGHIVSAAGMKADPDKVKVIRDLERPTNVKEIQRFCGFIQYLAKFLPKLSEICEPLRRLIKKDAEWCWESQQEEAFLECKKLATTAPVLRFYDNSKPLTLQVDASEKAMGATLLQEGQPVYFAARALTPTEQRYACIERECLAICFGCDKFDQYLAGKNETTIVESDHKPLETICKKSILCAPKRLQRMLLKLQRYNLEVKYKKGEQMYISDMLSRMKLPEERNPEEKTQLFYAEIEQISYAECAPKFTSATLRDIQKETALDNELVTLKRTVLGGWPETRSEVNPAIHEYWNYREEISIYDGILFKGYRVIVPAAMREGLLMKIHAAHLGVEACVSKAKESLFWPGIYTDIGRHVGACDLCQECAPAQANQPLQTPEIPTRPWQKIAVDLFQDNGKDYLITVDYFSDYFEIDKLYGTSSQSIISALEPHLARNGTVDVLVSDNGPNLVSREFARFCSSWEIEHATMSPHHSMANGKVESAVKVAKTLLKKCRKSGHNIHMALLDYRNTPCKYIGLSPAQRMFSRRTKTLLPMADELLKPEVHTDVPEKIKRKRQEAKKYFDRNTKVLPELVVGQPVYVHDRLQKKWTPGVVRKALTDRSYIVNQGNDSYRRNRIDIKPRTSPGEVEERQPISVEDRNLVSSPPETTDDVTDVPPNQPESAVRRSSRNKQRHTPYEHIP